MKTMMRKITTMLIVTVFACVCLVGCGAISIDDVKGDWTLDTINGQSLADYGAAAGLDENALYLNWTIKDDCTIDSTNASVSGTLKMELKGNGFEATEDASGSKFSVEFDKDAGTLTYKVDQGGQVNTCVMKKGTFTPTAAEEPAADEGSSVDDGSTDETEENLDEGSTDEEYDEEYDEEGYEEDYEEGDYEEEYDEEDAQ
ncbi:MAG: hypothetical protein J5819_08315 [Eubacterium sp.]|nr:hypothetical protein [Eubacterium sp.]